MASLKSRFSMVMSRHAAASRKILRALDMNSFGLFLSGYDSEKTVFYCDPPYVPTAKEYYGKPFTVDDLRDMANMLTTIKGKFLLKLNDRSYSYIQDILPEGKYVVEHVELPLYH